MMKLTDFYYDLPQELIAQDPLLKRSESRLMVLDRKDNTIEHKHFYDVIDYLNPGDCLVINDTRVLPARLMGVKEDTGASIEVLLLKRKDDCTWETLVKPGKKCKVGARIVFGSESNEPDPETGLIKGKLVGEVVDIVEEGNRLIRFEFDEYSRRSLTSWDRCHSLHISHISLRTRTDIRQFMQSMTVLRQHRLQDFTLQQSCLTRSKRRESR